MQSIGIQKLDTDEGQTTAVMLGLLDTFYLWAVVFNVVVFVALQKGNSGRVVDRFRDVQGFSFDFSGQRSPLPSWGGLALKFPCDCQEGLPWTMASLLVLMLANVE